MVRVVVGLMVVRTLVRVLVFDRAVTMASAAQWLIQHALRHRHAPHREVPGWTSGEAGVTVRLRSGMSTSTQSPDAAVSPATTAIAPP